MSTFVAIKEDIPSDFKLSGNNNAGKKSTSSLADKLLDGIVADSDVEVVDVVPVGGKDVMVKKEPPPELENDFQVARENIKSLMEKSTELLDEYAEMVKGADSPRAFEVFSKMVKDTAELSSRLIKLHESKEVVINGKQANNNNNNNSSGPQVGTVVQNQQNINISPAELIAMIKSGTNT